MCGRLTQRLSWREIHALLSLGGPAAILRARYNLAPSQDAAVVRNDAGERRLSLLRWGLIPAWAEDPGIGHKLINARAETAAVKPAFRAAFSKRRCLVPTDGFYEWRRDGSVRQPWLIARRDGGPMAFAGLWESWRVPEGAVLRGSLAEPRAGNVVETFTILTTEANATMSVPHHRMPVILPAEAFEGGRQSNCEGQRRVRETQQAYRYRSQSAPWRSIPIRAAGDRKAPVESASSAMAPEKATRCRATDPASCRHGPIWRSCRERHGCRERSRPGP